MYILLVDVSVVIVVAASMHFPMVFLPKPSSVQSLPPTRIHRLYPFGPAALLSSKGAQALKIVSKQTVFPSQIISPRVRGPRPMMMILRKRLPFLCEGILWSTNRCRFIQEGFPFLLSPLDSSLSWTGFTGGGKEPTRLLPHKESSGLGPIHQETSSMSSPNRSKNHGGFFFSTN